MELTPEQKKKALMDQISQSTARMSSDLSSTLAGKPSGGIAVAGLGNDATDVESSEEVKDLISSSRPDMTIANADLVKRNTGDMIADAGKGIGDALSKSAEKMIVPVNMQKIDTSAPEDVLAARKSALMNLLAQR